MAVSPPRSFVTQGDDDIYGHWERAERKIQAGKMEGAFPIYPQSCTETELVSSFSVYGGLGSCRDLQGFLDGPGWIRTNDLGIKVLPTRVQLNEAVRKGLQRL